MKSILGILLIIRLAGFSSAKSQSIPIVTFDQLSQLINRPNDTLYVVNFWATWCGPCVKELPQFEKVRQTYAAQPVRVLLVSMDNKSTLKTKVIPFIQNRKIKSRVVLLNEPDLNTWVDRLAPEWSGALPMTLIINSKRHVRQFIGKAVKEGELESLINQHKL